MENDKLKKKELIRRAQMNEFLYKLMRQNGIAARLDENIGVEFINLESTIDLNTAEGKHFLNDKDFIDEQDVLG